MESLGSRLPHDHVRLGEYSSVVRALAAQAWGPGIQLNPIVTVDFSLFSHSTKHVFIFS